MSIVVDKVVKVFHVAERAAGMWGHERGTRTEQGYWREDARTAASLAAVTDATGERPDLAWRGGYPRRPRPARRAIAAVLLAGALVIAGVALALRAGSHGVLVYKTGFDTHVSRIDVAGTQTITVDARDVNR